MQHPHHEILHRNDYGKLIAAILLLCLLAAPGYAFKHTTVSCFSGSSPSYWTPLISH